MGLSKYVTRGERGLFSVARVVNAIGVSIVLVIMLTTVADVALRYTFNQPVPGTVELTEYMMVFVVYCGIAWTQIKKGHVAVDIVAKRLTHKAQAILQSFTYVISLGIFCLASWLAFTRVKIVADSGLCSTALDIPRFPFQLVVGIGLGMLSLVLLADFIRSLAEAIRK